MDEGSLSLPPFTGHDEKSQRNYHLALRGNSLKLRRKSVTSSSANRTVWEHPLPWKRYRFQAINAAVY